MQLKKLASTLATAALVGGGAVLALATPAAAGDGGYEWSGDDWGHGHGHHGHHHFHNHTCVFKVRHGSHHADPKLHHGAFPAGRFRHYIRVHHRPHHHSRIVGYLHAGGYTIGKCHPVRGHHGGWDGDGGGWDGGGDGDWGGNWGHGFHGGHHFHKVKSHFKRHRWSPRTGFTEGWHLHKQYRWHRN